MADHVLRPHVALIARSELRPGQVSMPLSMPSSGPDDDTAPRFSLTDFIVGLVVVLAACIVAVIGSSFLWH